MTKPAKKYTDSVTSRFIQICREVVAAGMVANKTEFAESVGEYQQNLSLMEKGSRAPTIEQICLACEVYNYSPSWLMMGIGDKTMQKPGKRNLEQRLNEIESEVNIIKRALAHKKSIVNKPVNKKRRILNK